MLKAEKEFRAHQCTLNRMTREVYQAGGRDLGIVVHEGRVYRACATAWSGLDVEYLGTVDDLSMAVCSKSEV